MSKFTNYSSMPQDFRDRWREDGTRRTPEEERELESQRFAQNLARQQLEREKQSKQRDSKTHNQWSALIADHEQRVRDAWTDEQRAQAKIGLANMKQRAAERANEIAEHLEREERAKHPYLIQMRSYLEKYRSVLTDEQRGQLEAIVDVFGDDPSEAHTRFFETTGEIFKARLVEKQKAHSDTAHARTKANLDAAQAEVEAVETEGHVREARQQLEQNNVGN